MRYLTPQALAIRTAKANDTRKHGLHRVTEARYVKRYNAVCQKDYPTCNNMQAMCAEENADQSFVEEGINPDINDNNQTTEWLHYFACSVEGLIEDGHHTEYNYQKFEPLKEDK